MKDHLGDARSPMTFVRRELGRIASPSRATLEVKRAGGALRLVGGEGVLDARTSLTEAAAAAGIPLARFRVLNQVRWQFLLADILDRFTRHSHRGVRWLWDDLKEVPATFVLDGPADTLAVLPLVLPKRTPIWFLAEDFSGRKEHGALWLFETDTEVLAGVLREHHPFEYAVVGPHLEWLVAENHHNVLFAVAELVAGRLLAAPAALDAQGPRAMTVHRQHRRPPRVDECARAGVHSPSQNSSVGTKPLGGDSTRLRSWSAESCRI